MRPRSVPGFLSCLLILCAIPFAPACSSGADPDSSQAAGSQGDGGSGSSSNSGSGGAGGAGGGNVAMAGCTDKTPVACSDEVILQMNLQKDIAPGKIDNEPDGSGFLTTADARAGGFGAKDPDSYVYGRFTDAGLEKVEMSDEDSLESMDWDIAFRRYIIRINSGNSGPSCVKAARVPGMVKYDDLTAAPDNLVFHGDDYFTESCELIPDGSGLDGSPATALASYWTYPGCVQMTGHVYVVELHDGKQIKLAVSSYYSEAAQAECDSKGSTSGTGSAILRVRWAYLP